jgi:nucleoside-diphosphate-sugar epimerase
VLRLRQNPLLLIVAATRLWYVEPDLPLTEKHPAPVNPYAVSKAAQDLLAYQSRNITTSCAGPATAVQSGPRQGSLSCRRLRRRSRIEAG